jgi:hypothetical protein
MKANSKNFKNNENDNFKNHIKSILINNIPNTQIKNNNSKKQIKNKRATNYFTINNNINQNYNSKTINMKENIFSGKSIFEHISINNSLLLTAYEKSLFILFDSLKSYMKNDLQFFNNLKENFIKNVQKFYQKNKFKLSKMIPKNRNNTKSYTNLTFHRKNNSHLNFIINNQSSRKSILCIPNNSLSKSNTSIQTLNNNLPQNNTNKKINRITHKKSLYTLMKGSNRTPSSNNAIKNLIKKDYNYNLSILKSFIEFNKNNRTKTKKNDFGNKTNQDINKINNYSQNINSNEIINKIPNVIEKNEEETKDNNLIACIKNSLDDNLKNMFDFSYQSFLNKESEREG